MSGNAKIEALLTRMLFLSDVGRELMLQKLAEEYGEGFAKSIRNEFARRKEEKQA